jgi:hypothetical protein
MNLYLQASLCCALTIGLLAVPPGISAVHAAESVPAPRDANGKVLIANMPGEPVGLWVTDYSTRIPFFKIEDIKFKPWAKGLYDARQAHDLEPHARCKASGAIRQFLTPYGVEILEVPELQQVFIFDLGGPHSWRTIYMDGRSHPDDLEASNYGYSIGRWQGDTLVVDTIGVRDDTWIDWNGSVLTEAAKVREEITRPDYGHIEIRVTVDDPKAYTKPWTVTLKQRVVVNAELIDEICLENEQFVELMGVQP